MAKIDVTLKSKEKKYYCKLPQSKPQEYSKIKESLKMFLNTNEAIMDHVNIVETMTWIAQAQKFCKHRPAFKPIALYYQSLKTKDKQRAFMQTYKFIVEQALTVETVFPTG